MLQTFIFIRFCVVLLGIGIVPLSLPWIAPGATVTQGSPSACGGGKECCQGRKNSVGNGGDQDSFLGLAVMQICGDQVLHALAQVRGDWVVMTWCSRKHVGADAWEPGYSWSSQQLVFAYFIICRRQATQICGDQLAPAHKQWRRSMLSNEHAPCGPRHGAHQTATATHQLLPAAKADV